MTPCSRPERHTPSVCGASGGAAAAIVVALLGTCTRTAAWAEGGPVGDARVADALVAAMADGSAKAPAGAPMPTATWRPDGLGVQFTSQRFSDPLPLSDLLANRLAGLSARHGQSLIYVRDEARLTAHRGSLSLSALARQSATLTASRGAVVLTQDLSQDGPPAGAYRADVAVSAQGFGGWGMALAWGNLPSDPGLGWQVGLQSLQLQRLLVRDITGWAQFNPASGSYDTHLNSNLHDDRHRYPFQAPWGSQGWALLLDAALRWQAPGSAWAWSASVSDWGRLHWRRLPREQATLDTQVTRTDADGNLAYKPLLNGRNTNEGFGTWAVATWQLGAEWAWQPGRSVVLQLRRMGGVRATLPYTGLQWAVNAQTQLSLGWLSRERAAVLGAQWGPWSVQLAADALDGSAHTRQAHLSWRQRW